MNELQDLVRKIQELLADTTVAKFDEQKWATLLESEEYRKAVAEANSAAAMCLVFQDACVQPVQG